MSIFLITYLIRVSISILILYGFYRLLFRERTFFQLNRIYLIISVLLSFLIPLISLGWTSSSQITNEFIPSYIAPIQESAHYLQHQISKPLQIKTPAWSLTLGELLILGYGIVCLYFLSKFFLKIAQITRIIKESQLATYKKTTTLIHPSMPVSTFFTYLFWKENGSEDDQIIYEHERVHIRQWHSLDIIFLEIIAAILWFNPVIKLYKSEIQLLHEYIADAYVVQHLADKSRYTKLLYSQRSISHHPYAQAFASFLSDRIRMMMRRKSSISAATTYMLTFPVTVCLMLLLSSSENSEYLTRITDKVSALESREIIRFPIATPHGGARGGGMKSTASADSSFIRANYRLQTHQLINMIADGNFQVESENNEKQTVPIQQIRMVNLVEATDFYWNERNPPIPFDQSQFVKELNENRKYEIVHLFLGNNQVSAQVEVHLLDEHLQSYYLKFENKRFVAAPYLAAHGNYTRPTNYVEAKELASLLSKPTIPIVVHGEEQLLRNTKIVNTLNYGKDLNRDDVTKNLQKGKLDHPLSLIGIASQGRSYIINFADSETTVEIMQNLDFEWGEMQYSNIDQIILPTTRAWRISIASIKEMFRSSPSLRVNGELVEKYILTISYLDHFGNQTNSELQIKNGNIIDGKDELDVIEQLLAPGEFLNGINITADGKTTRTHKRVVIMN